MEYYWRWQFVLPVVTEMPSGGIKTIEVLASVALIIDESEFDDCSKDLCFITPAGSYAEQWALEHGFQVKNK